MEITKTETTIEIKLKSAMNVTAVYVDNLDNFKNEGFVEVQDELRPHDVILFTLGRTYHVNHAGVYLGSNTLTSEETEEVIGDSLFIHHPYNKNSIREIYGNYWNDRTSFILRHKELL